MWSFAGDGQLAGSPIVVNQYVFIGSASGNLYALDGSTGRQMWQVSPGSAIDSTVYQAGTHVTAYTLSIHP